MTATTAAAIANQPATILPGVDDWYALSRQYPEYAKVSGTVLKDYGYMAISSEIEKRLTDSKLRVMEFGHLFNAELFQRFEDRVEMWGLDDVGNEHYIPQGKQWEDRYKAQLLDRCPNTKFVRGYLGRDRAAVPAEHFDILCSVSVYDNVEKQYWDGLTKHAFEVLKPGGAFINTYDFRLRHTEAMIKDYLEVQSNAGFEVAQADNKLSDHNALIECQFAVITWYQGGEPAESRRYGGNWGTILTVAVKPL